MGLDVYLRNGLEPDYDKDYEEWRRQFNETQARKSAKYPEHMCGPRYLRSSYNSAGFNSVVRDLIGEDLYTIFDPDLEKYDWHPTTSELEGARTRALGVIEKLKVIDKPLAAFDVSSLGFGAGSDAEAIRITKEQLSKGSFDAFSSKEGFFSKKGLTIHGAVTGRVYGQSTVYLVHEIDLEWYIQMAEIVVEFIDEALSMPDPRISWSG